MANLKKHKSRKKTSGYQLGSDASTQLQLKVMLWPSVLLIFVFTFIPLFGIIIAFKDYRPADGVIGFITSPWNHFRNFKLLFKSYQFFSIMRNTIGINLLNNLIGIPVTLVFALLLNEMMNKRFKSLVQTVTYMPHFLSWVVFGGLFINLLNPDGGLVNVVLMRLHLIDAPIRFLVETKYFWGIAIVTSLLKDLGWGAILYLAAIAGIDPTLYESAMIDGAGRAKKMWHITIPCIMPTIMILVIFAVSGMLNNNFTQIYVFQNALNISASQVIDTYVYQVGLQHGQFGVATAISLMKSLLAVFLLLGANGLSNKLTKTGLF